MEVDKALNLCPLLRIALMLILGIVMGDAIGCRLPLWLGLALTAVAVVGGLTIGRKYETVQGVCIMMGVLLLGATLVCWKNTLLTVSLAGTPQRYQAIVTSEPQERGKTIRCDLVVTRLDNQILSRPFNVKAGILKDTTSQRWKRLHVGDGIEGWSVFEPLSSFYPESNFNYVRWLHTHGFVAQTFIYYRNWKKAAVSTAGLSRFERVKIRAMKLRNTMLERYRMLGLSQDQYAVVAAMTLGDKSGLTQALKTQYSVTGASHVLALSGLHLGIIYAVLILLLGRWKRRQWLVRAVVLLAIWMYVVLVGLPTSAIRSATMLTVYSVCVVLGRQRASVNTLAFAALVMLVVSPLSLWDVGFQMSFMAVLGILVYYRPIFHALTLQNTAVRWLWGLTVVSLSAQIGTAPLVMYYFGRFACYSILTNIIVVPAATLILYGAVLMLLAMPVVAVQKIIATAMAYVSGLLNTLLGHIAQLPGASIENISINTWQVYLIYMVIFSTTFLAHYAMKIRQQERLDTFG